MFMGPGMSETKEEQVIDISPDALISCIQEKRMRMLLDIDKVDKDKRYLMNEIAETAVACKKIKSDENISNGESESASAIANAIAGLGYNPFHADHLKGVERKPIEAPALPNVDIKPGETSTDLQVFNYENIMNKKEG